MAKHTNKGAVDVMVEEFNELDTPISIQYDEKVEVEAEAEVEAEVEKPKVKKGNKNAAVTTIDTGVKVKDPAAPRRLSIPKSGTTYRLLSGVLTSSFNGQRRSVVESLNKLKGIHGEDSYFTLEQIVENVDGLVSSTPIENSVLYHLKGLIGKDQVMFLSLPKAEKAAPEKEQEAA